MMAQSKKLLLFFFGLSLLLPAGAQIPNTLFFMDGIPQTNRYNPAYQPQTKIYVGVPFISPARAGVSTTTMAYGDFIQEHPYEDSLITFLHPLADRDAFMDRLKSLNLIYSNFGSSLLSFGFQTRAGFFSMDLVTKMDGNLRYPKDLVELLVYGTDPSGTRTYEMDGMGADISVYNELAFGWSRKLSEKLSVGARAKVLFGLSDMYTKNSELSFTPTADNWHIESDMQLNMSLGFAEVVYDENDKIEDIVVDDDLAELNTLALAKYAFRAGNMGFGVDLGVVYKPMEELTLSGSVVDLGFIKWKEEVHEISYIMEYDFPGIELHPVSLLEEEYDLGDYLDSTLSQMVDSLGGFMQMAPGSSYTKMLNAKLILGASYQVHPSIHLGLVSRTDFLNDFVAEQLTLSSNFKVLEMMDLSLSYSYMYGHFRNFGAGLAMNIGPVNAYVVSDNILNFLIWPKKTMAANLWFGLNILIGYKDKPDMPLVQ